MASPRHTSTSSTKNMRNDVIPLFLRTVRVTRGPLTETASLSPSPWTYRMATAFERCSFWDRFKVDSQARRREMTGPPSHRGWTRAGSEPRPWTPLVSSHFTSDPVQLSWICLSQQISMFLSKSCQFFFPRRATNLPRVSKQTVERALAFEPE